MTPEEIKLVEARWKSDVDKKLDQLVSFADKYEQLLDMLMERERDRDKLRKAIIEKTLTGLTWFILIVLGTALVSYAQSIIKRGS